MKSPAKLNINLLPKDPFLGTPIGRFLQWALSVGRYLVIFTELVVIISFATRFNLDRKVTDLNGTIHQKRVVIESYGDLAGQVETTQKKIEQQFNLADAFAALSEITPQDITLSQLQVQQNTVIFSGKTLSSPSLNLLINNIQLSPKFKDVVVDNIQSASDKDPGFHFEIRAKIVQPST